VLSPRFFANLAHTVQRHDRIEVASQADTFRALHLTLIVDTVNRLRRIVVVKELWRAVTTPRLLPCMSDHE
jgi:hypothetical protein